MDEKEKENDVNYRVPFDEEVVINNSYLGDDKNVDFEVTVDDLRPGLLSLASIYNASNKKTIIRAGLAALLAIGGGYLLNTISEVKENRPPVLDFEYNLDSGKIIANAVDEDGDKIKDVELYFYKGNDLLFSTSMIPVDGAFDSSKEKAYFDLRDILQTNYKEYLDPNETYVVKVKAIDDKNKYSELEATLSGEQLLYKPIVISEKEKTTSPIKDFNIFYEPTSQSLFIDFSVSLKDEQPLPYTITIKDELTGEIIHKIDGVVDDKNLEIPLSLQDLIIDKLPDDAIIEGKLVESLNQIFKPNHNYVVELKVDNEVKEKEFLTDELPVVSLKLKYDSDNTTAKFKYEWLEIGNLFSIKGNASESNVSVYFGKNIEDELINFALEGMSGDGIIAYKCGDVLKYTVPQNSQLNFTVVEIDNGFKNESAFSVPLKDFDVIYKALKDKLSFEGSEVKVSKLDLKVEEENIPVYLINFGDDDTSTSIYKYQPIGGSVVEENEIYAVKFDKGLDNSENIQEFGLAVGDIPEIVNMDLNDFKLNLQNANVEVAVEGHPFFVSINNNTLLKNAFGFDVNQDGDLDGFVKFNTTPIHNISNLEDAIYSTLLQSIEDGAKDISIYHLKDKDAFILIPTEKTKVAPVFKDGRLLIGNPDLIDSILDRTTSSTPGKTSTQPSGPPVGGDPGTGGGVVN